MEEQLAKAVQEARPQCHRLSGADHQFIMVRVQPYLFLLFNCKAAVRVEKH